MENFSRAFGSITLAARQHGVLTISPPNTPYFEPNRIRIAVINPRDPDAKSDLKISAVTVGGSPQLAMNNLLPNEETPGIRPQDINGARINWSAFSSPGLSRELQMTLFNPGHDPVYVFVCLEGLPNVHLNCYAGDPPAGYEVSKTPAPQDDKRSNLENPEDFTTSYISSSDELIEPGGQRVVHVIPQISPYFEPLTVRYMARREDDGKEVPFCILEAFCSNQLLYNVTKLSDLFRVQGRSQVISNPPPTRRLLKMLSDRIDNVEKYGAAGARDIEYKMYGGRIHSDPRGILSTLLVRDDGTADVRHWPTFSTSGLNKELGIVAFNPWPFEIRASVSMAGYPVADMYEKDEGAEVDLNADDRA